MNGVMVCDQLENLDVQLCNLSEVPFLEKLGYL
jgi:hypothetical protein